MYRRPISLTILCVAAIVLLALPAESRAGQIWDCLFGNAPPSQTTYAPAYVAPTYVAPTYTPYAPSCSPCAPQTCQYMPTVVYRALYRPAAYNPWTGSTITTYRPFLGTYQTRLVPYATYRPIYVPAISYQSYCSPSVSCGPVGCGVPTSDCLSCPAAPQAVPQTVPQSAPKTFQQKVEKPAADPGLQPIPQPDAQLNSMPAPMLPDPNDRTAVRPTIRRATRVQAAAYTAASPSERNDGGWRPVED
ncbi:MAG: hypothetical protein K8R46_14035 [Pirellulales bacterium]|nr:hypothetical protein [Pirellulales bacterium]